MKSVLSVAAFVVATAWSAQAGSIDLALDSSAAYADGVVTATAVVTNRGADHVTDVSAILSVGDAAAETTTRHSLYPGDLWSGAVELAPPQGPPGQYPLLIRLRYHDINGYPLDEVDFGLVATGEPPERDWVDVTISSARMTTHAVLDVSLMALSAIPIAAHVRVVGPEALRIAGPGTAITLEPGREITLPVRVEDNAARPGSVYRILAIVDFDLDGRHHTIVDDGYVKILPDTRLAGMPRWIVLTTAAFLIIVAVAGSLYVRLRKPPATADDRGDVRFAALVDIAVVTCATLYIALQLSPDAIVLDTMTVGGDTPAHNYLAGHLKHALLTHGDIISWAPGWWCGFPMFQYYFALPYAVIGALSLALPFNVAFKLTIALSLMALPAAACVSARMMRLPPPAPAFLAVAAIPFLFDSSHTMWGANIYSAFSGMIANAMSFPLMLLFLGSIVRDVKDGQARLRTVFVLALMVASHFFTSIIALLCAAALPFIAGGEKRLRTMVVVAVDCAVGLLLMAWWLVPLIATQEYTADYGANWNVELLTTAPPFAVWIAPLTCIGLYSGLRHGRTAPLLLAVMGMVAALLFTFGYDLHGVFVNVRLWPFMLFAYLGLAAMGCAWLFEGTRWQVAAVSSVLIAVIVSAHAESPSIRAWSRWNFEGMQQKRAWPVMQEILSTLDGTPGRFANDLHVDNAAFGSQRIFEALPHLIGKPVLEGGIVNSAYSSAFSYFVQCETSDVCAGLPNNVVPTTFNMKQASRHLRLFNVMHFLARSPATRDAFTASSDWDAILERDGWTLFEARHHNGNPVTIPRHAPVGVRSDTWQADALEWLYVPGSTVQPVAFIETDSDTRSETPFDVTMPRADLMAYLDGLSAAADPAAALGSPLPRPAAPKVESFTGREIRFTTEAVGSPHIIAMTYHPNWIVTGAGRIYPAAPCFMLVYPTAESVTLRYHTGAADHAGRVLSLLGWVGALGILLFRWRRNRKSRTVPEAPPPASGNEGPPV